MCGIAGLHLRDRDLFPRLGALIQEMLLHAADRGPDSAGIGLYGDPTLTPAGSSTVSILGVDAVNDGEIAALVAVTLGLTPEVRTLGETTLVIAAVDVETLSAAVRTALPAAVVIGRGSSLAVLKGTGHPSALAETWDLGARSGYQAVAHTRMATESAVTATGSHPFSVGVDQCLVHNGSFSNHAAIRRELVAQGERFDSDNDSEVGARFVARRLAEGEDMDKALRRVCERFDGFYTLLVSSASSFAVVRDAIACKPAVVAQTDAWVAMASEYRYLAGLPGIETARIVEPEPEVVYAWER